MTFRSILVSAGCIAAALGIGSNRAAAAGDFQQANAPANPLEPCSVTLPGDAQIGGCGRIGG
ncbi:MAG: hypothetical protein J2P49_10990, partial [Methylocapsa sp.]|nr:hypothetical protein [Methylocapsa sp.]